MFFDLWLHTYDLLHLLIRCSPISSGIPMSLKFLIFIRALVIGFRAHPTPIGPCLNQLHLNSPVYKVTLTGVIHRRCVYVICDCWINVCLSCNADSPLWSVSIVWTHKCSLNDWSTWPWQWWGGYWDEVQPEILKKGPNLAQMLAETYRGIISFIFHKSLGDSYHLSVSYYWGQKGQITCPVLSLFGLKLTSLQRMGWLWQTQGFCSWVNDVRNHVLV